MPLPAGWGSAPAVVDVGRSLADGDRGLDPQPVSMARLIAATGTVQADRVENTYGSFVAGGPVRGCALSTMAPSQGPRKWRRAQSGERQLAGEYTAPTFEFIFPENVKPGDLLVPFDFWHLPFIRFGEGAGTASAVGPSVGALEPAPW